MIWIVHGCIGRVKIKFVHGLYWKYKNSGLDPLIYEMSFLDYFWNTLYNSNLINIRETICVGLYLMNKNKIS